MFEKLLKGLTREQKSALREAGIPDQYRSDWLHDRRTPTEAELLMLAHVAEVDVKTLLEEIALKRVKPKQRALLERALGKVAAGVAAMLIGFGASDRAPGAGASAAWPDRGNEPSRKGNRRKKTRRSPSAPLTIRELSNSLRLV